MTGFVHLCFNLIQSEEEERHRNLAQSRANYEHILNLESKEFITNTEAFDCPVCFDEINPGDGVVLRECLHKFCKYVY